MINNKETAFALIRNAKEKFLEAEGLGKDTLKKVLERFGEAGMVVAKRGDARGDVRISTAEVDIDDIRPIHRIRFYEGKLQLLLTDYDKLARVTDEGEWVDYDSVVVDTWYLLDKVEASIDEGVDEITIYKALVNKDIIDAEDILSQFGKVTFVDEKIDDGCDEEGSEDEYVMMRSFNVGYKYVRIYYGNNSGTIGDVSVRNI